jgi:hypothetical protein
LITHINSGLHNEGCVREKLDLLVSGRLRPGKS